MSLLVLGKNRVKPQKTVSSPKRIGFFESRERRWGEVVAIGSWVGPGSFGDFDLSHGKETRGREQQLGIGKEPFCLFWYFFVLRSVLRFLGLCFDVSRMCPFCLIVCSLCSGSFVASVLFFLVVVLLVGRPACRPLESFGMCFSCSNIKNSQMQKLEGRKSTKLPILTHAFPSLCKNLSLPASPNRSSNLRKRNWSPLVMALQNTPF